MIRSSLLVPVLLLAAAPARAQLVRSHAAVLPLDEVARTEVRGPDLARVHAEDLERERAGLPPRFAIPSPVSITPATHGTWEDLDADTLLWRLRIQAPDARSLNLGFGRYALPPGAELWIYSADLVHVVQPFTAADNEEHGELWTPVVESDDLVVELVLPLAELEHFELELSQIGYGYRGFGTPLGGGLGGEPDSGSCNLDVVCPEGDEWRMEIPAVGVISLGGSTFCSGFLVNNVRADRTPYFMTARHCGITSGNAQSLVVYWNYENSFCRTPGSAQSAQAGNGSRSQFNTGSIWRASYSPSDFTLVELDDDPNPAFELTYAGWNATGADATSAVAIHHPQTQEKRISFEFQPTSTTSYLSNPVPGDGTHVRVTDWDLGTTEGGSSGSPLFNQTHEVIGQLHGGFASCSSQTSDWYGKFSRSFPGGGTTSTSLKPWLDPDDTGLLRLATLGASCPASSVTFRNGSGVNAPCLTSLSTPVIGGTWQVGIDTSVVAGATFSILVLYKAGASGLVVGPGEILVDLSSNFLASSNQPASGGVDLHTVNIPDNPALAGFRFHAQGGVGTGSLVSQLCNAQLVVLGCTP